MIKSEPDHVYGGNKVLVASPMTGLNDLEQIGVEKQPVDNLD